MEDWIQQIVVVAVNAAVLFAAFGFVWWSNRSWAHYSRRLNADWATCCKKMNAEHGEQVRRIFDEWKTMNKELREEHNEALDRLHEGWAQAVRTTLDQMEDRYFRYTKRVTELRDPPSERS